MFQWDPVANQWTDLNPPNNPFNLFCSGHTHLSDGRLLIIGGIGKNGIPPHWAEIFDPFLVAWTDAMPMTSSRFYATATTLPNGRVLATSGVFDIGQPIVPIPEVFDPVANTWTQLPGASLGLPTYALMFVLPDGRILQASCNEFSNITRVLNIATQTWTIVDPNVLDVGSAVMYLPGMVMAAGASAEGGQTGLAKSTTYVLDMTQARPVWHRTASMNSPRAHHNLTVLADGTVLVTGGGLKRDGQDASQAVYTAELWSPSTQTWTTMASMQTPRLYHSTALLLPDGRVLVTGGGAAPPEVDQPSAEIYAPPYLFKGGGVRPNVTSAPGSVSYGAQFTVGTNSAASITSVTWVRLGAVTHSFNHEQRFLNLSFSANSSSLTVTAPANANLAPPGYYMLFLINSNGVPSIAQFVRIG
jgi:hypothetical protein